tara:strand:- start:7104 stop:7490 length:387 start_codon:yes stop_codon:yes gene_type:complete
MYAIIDIKGKQFKVEKNLELNVPKLEGKVGSKVEFDKTLLVNNKGEISTNSSVKVTAKILSHELDKKIIVFKQKRRKGYQKKNGHKQAYTKIMVQDLKAATKAKKSTATKTATKKTTATKAKKVETDK